MSNSSYIELLDAAIEHLKNERARGVRYINVDEESLASLSRPISVTQAPAGPAVTTAAGPASLPPTRSADSENGSRPGSSNSTPISTPIVPTLRKRPEIVSPQPAPFIKAPVLTPEEKEVAIQALRKKALACTLCDHLVKSRTQVVFGVGDIHAKIMFVGEAPGADEDEQGEPFVGKAGQLLTKIIVTMGLSREQVYIGNILKCRPDTPGQTSGNRKPEPEEMQTCIPYLHQQIDIIQPQVLVALGSTAVEGLLGQPVMITKMRGIWKSYRGIPLMPTYHPSYLLRNQAMAVKREVWEDMLAVLEKVGLHITAKQKGYFL